MSATEDNARTEAVKPEWLKAWLVLREGRLRDLDSNDPGWPSGVEMFVLGFNAGASRKDEAAPTDAKIIDTFEGYVSNMAETPEIAEHVYQMIAGFKDEQGTGETRTTRQEHNDE